jgi:hypothetical protein
LDGLEPGVEELPDGDALVFDELSGLLVAAHLGELGGHLGAAGAVDVLAAAFAVLPAQFGDAEPAAVRALGDVPSP